MSKFDTIGLITQSGLPGAPAAGDVVFQASKMRVYSGSAWETFSAVNPSGESASITMESGAVILNDAGSASDPSYSFSGDDDTGMFLTGTDTIGLVGNGAAILNLAASSTPVNYWEMSSSDAASPVELKALGSDTNISMLLDPKGTGTVTVADAATYDANVGATSLVTKAWVENAISGGAAGSVALDDVAAADGAATIANGANQITWNWQLTSDGQRGMFFGETADSTNGAGDQPIVMIQTNSETSTADPFAVFQGPNQMIRCSAGGALSLQAGDASGNPGSISIQGGTATGTDQDGSNIFIRTGNGNGTGDGGYIELKPGLAPGAGADGYVYIASISGLAPEVRWQEDDANGDNYIGLKAPNSVAANVVYDLPAAGVEGQHLVLGASNAMEWDSDEAVLIASTTDDTETELVGAGTTYFTITDETAYAVELLVVGRKEEGDEHAMWKILVGIQRTGGTTALVGSDVTTTISNTPGWSVAVSADDANDRLAVKVTGGAATTNINWKAKITAVSVLASD